MTQKFISINGEIYWSQGKVEGGSEDVMISASDLLRRLMDERSEMRKDPRLKDIPGKLTSRASDPGRKDAIRESVQKLIQEIPRGT